MARFDTRSARSPSRRDLCELQVVGGGGGNRDADTRDFQHIVSTMHTQPWWTSYQFDQDTGMVAFSDDGRIDVIWFYSRK